MHRKITRLFRRPSSKAKAKDETQRAIAHDQHEAVHEPAKEIEVKARTPVPLDSTKPSVAQLPDHVVHIILDLLQHVRPEAVRDIALVSPSLYEQARYAQNQHVRIDLDKANHGLNRLDLIGRLGQAAAVQAVRVVGCKLRNQDAKDVNQVLARLVSIIPSMTGLRHFDWHVTRPSTASARDHAGPTSLPIPSDMLEVLPQMVRLHTSVCCNALQDSHVEARTFLRNLKHNQNLSTLSVDVIYMNDQMCLDTMRALKCVLLSCPNLTRLPQIDVHYPRGTCFGGGPMNPYCGLGFSGHEKPPPLQELGIREYPWGDRRIIGYPIEAWEGAHWVSTFDWSRLVRLNFMASHLASSLVPHLAMLRELVFEDPTYDMEFLDGVVSPLETLSFMSWDRIGNDLGRVTKFAPTLRRLRVHEDESGWRYDPHRFITRSDLMLLSTSLPNLQHLALDMERDKEAQQWPYAALDAIAAFPSLETVELWFPLGYESPAPTPLLTVSSASHLGGYLRDQNENIQRVTLHSGAPSPSWVHPSAHFLGTDLYIPGPSWAKHNSVTFEYGMVYDGDVMNRRRSSVTCLDLSSGMNRRLRQLAQGTNRQETDPEELNEDDIRLIAALDGPLDKPEWNAWFEKQPEVIAHRAENKRIYDEIEAMYDRMFLRRRLAKLVRRTILLSD
ncbi:hypothetical protein ACHAPT_012303 [Fusarium lateritium]